jgi:hypothetical protein
MALMQNHFKTGNLAKVAIAMAALAGFLAFSSAPVRADDDCQHKIAKIDHNLHEAIEHHGPDSKQAERWRNELAVQRERCWNGEHRWWDADDHRWHTDRDWNDHDHDHNQNH